MPFNLSGWHGVILLLVIGTLTVMQFRWIERKVEY